MKASKFSKRFFSVQSILFLILILAVETGYTQYRTDTVRYHPKISFSAANGLGPYIIGTKQENAFTVWDLPYETSGVHFKFIDVDGKRVGHAHTVSGSSLESASWAVELDTFNLPLSPRLSIKIEYEKDSNAIYNIPYVVYPDTVLFKATEGWGPFITNNYQFTDTTWHPVPDLNNTFTISNLPPRTDTIKFQIIAADSTVIDSLLVIAPTGQYLDSAVFANVRMDNLPPSTRYIRALIWCNGGPGDGLSYHKNLIIVPQKPKLISKSEGIMLHDSIGPFIQNQVAGNALAVDSLKYAIINNGPGLPLEYGWQFQGPYSLDLIEGTFSIEAWLKLDLHKLWNNQGNNSMYFMMIDSVWAIYVHSYWDQIVFEIASLADGNEYWLYGFKTGFDSFSDSAWHHIAFSFNGQSNPIEYAFFLDGEIVESVFSPDNYNTVKNNTNYTDYFLTKPLLLGGCLSYLTPNTTDYSFITAMDEVRIWNRALTGEEIKTNYKKSILQDSTLVGYWSFNDRRNRLGTISDISYHNNSGKLKNGATFIPQYPMLQITMDTIEIISSNIQTDSIIFSFIDNHNEIIDSYTLLTYNGKDTLIYDISSLPYKLNHLRVSEYYPGVVDTGFNTYYYFKGWAPSPIATPYYNWNTFYYTPVTFGSLYNSITVSDFPKNTEKVILGVTDGSTIYDTVSYTQSSIPYGYSLTLNGIDNYIETSQKIQAPRNFIISLWFKTSTKKGGKIIGFTDTQNGITNGNYDRGLYLEPDGSLRFRFSLTDEIYHLYGTNIYNDGAWHNVKVKIDNDVGDYLYIDDCMVDFLPGWGGTVYEGYWVIGRNNKSQNFLRDSISEYFEGSLCDIKIEHLPRNSEAPENIIFSSQKSRNDGLHYKLDEGTGTTVTDSLGNNNGIIKGSTPIWSSSNKLSTVRWRKNMTNHPPDQYTFFSRVFYPGGPDTGLVYPLGRYPIKDPFPGEVFYYNVFGVLGYFNEGTHLEFPIHYYCGYDFQGQYDWKDNLFKYSVYSPDHRLIHDTTIYYISNNNMGYVGFDAGEAPPGSYMNFTFGYREDNSYNTEVYEHTFSMPVYTKPMIPPIVSGNFGPFDQAIAPGVMQRENTFVITTEIYSDLNKVTGRFYNENNEEIASADAVKINETTWHLTYDMATLSPPFTLLEIDYYLGDDEFLGLVQGPFKITIHRTRPVWFDFIPDADFHNATQTGDLVTFNISTTLSQNYLFDNTLEIEIPSYIPIIGETSSKLDAPSTNIYLKYIIPEYKLELNEPPEFYNSVINLGGGKAKYMAFHFNAEQHNSYYLDEHNNLFATQNFAEGGSLTSTLEKVENLTEKVVEMINDAADVNPDEILVSPDFEINFTGSFEYSSRLHLTIDTLTGKWGTVGNLHVDANPEHEEAFKNSASFHFYSGSLGVNFGTGIKVFDGVFGIDFFTDMRFILGFGQSYRDLPYYQKRVLKSFAFQIYGKIVTKELWGWFEQTVWGPKMFYSTILWGDDMTDAFPPAEKKDQIITGIPSNSDWPELTDEIIPVSDFFVTPLGYPQQNIQNHETNLLFTWIEKGETFGERCLQARYLERSTGKFSDRFTVSKNFNAINYPASTFVNETTLFFAWNQSRYTSETIAEVQPEEVNRAFVGSQDIWVGVYDIETDSIIQHQMIEDVNYSLTSGRTEAHPEIVALSDSRVLITWQVVDMDNHKSDLWYVVAEKQVNQWVLSTPSVIAEVDGIETDIRLLVPVEDQAVLLWMNTNRENRRQRRLMTTKFNGSDWSQPEELVAFNDYHYINYLDMEFTNGTGAVVWTTFVEDTTFNRYETLSLLPWDPVQNRWRKNEKVILYSDSIHHIQLPQITIDNDGNSVIAIKVEQIINPSGKSKISQVDLFKGNINSPHGTWDHIIANQFVCDTLKQVSNLELTFRGTDTLMILSQEYMMAATNAPFEPKNGIMFGDPYMNLVLRSFMIDEEGMVEDIDEHNYFLGIEDEFDFTSSVKLYQNYPNPCTDHTTIQFYIPDNGQVKLELYDMNGILVSSMVDQKLQPGIYEIELNVSLLKPGFYFYRLISGDSKQTLKMVVGN